jgi:hypothetical protein
MEVEPDPLIGSIFFFRFLLILLDKRCRSPNHVYGKGIDINLHRLFGLFPLDMSLLDNHLNLPFECTAFIGVMRIGVVPLAPLLLLEFFS